MHVSYSTIKQWLDEEQLTDCLANNAWSMTEQQRRKIFANKARMGARKALGVVQ